MSDYLWDRSGKPDPEIAALEDALSELRFDKPMPPMPAKRRPHFWWLLAAAAAVLVVVAWTLREEPVRVSSEWPTPSVAPVSGDSWKVARLSGAPWPVRFAYAVAALALPPVLFGRIVARVAVRPPYRAPLARSLPLLVLFVVSWAYGEIVGAVAGPGDSLSRVS